MQNEITSKQALHDDKGHLINPGYAKKMLFEYDRKKIKAAGFKIKEWDYYLINNDDWAIAFTIADNSYLGFVSVSLLDFKTATFETFSTLKPFTFGKFNMPSTSVKGDIKYQDKKINITFLNDGKNRIIICHIPNFKHGTPLSCELDLTNEPQESMVIATPFKENKKAFYFNQKLNCMQADGKVQYGDQTIEFKDAYAVLDWGRGVWTYDNTWFWGTASGKLNGKKFGINVGYGFGDLSNATENMIFYDGLAHKFDQVEFVIVKVNGKYDYMNDWQIVSNDGRLDITFTPILDRFDKISLLLIVSDQHQVFGKMNGFAILDDGTKLEINDLLGSAEVVHNRW